MPFAPFCKFLRAFWDIFGYAILVILYVPLYNYTAIKILSLYDPIPKIIIHLIPFLFYFVPLVAIILFQLLTGSLRDTFSLQKPSIRDITSYTGFGILVSILCSSSVLILLICDSYPLPSDEYLLSFSFTSDSALGVACIILIGPILEEILFRGIILKRLLKYIPVFPAVLIQAILFSAMHREPFQLPYTFIMGIILGYVFVWSRSLWPVILIHIINNVMSCLFGSTSFLYDYSHPLVPLVTTFFISGTSFIILFRYFYKKRIPPLNLQHARKESYSILPPLIIFGTSFLASAIIVGYQFFKNSPDQKFSTSVSSFKEKTKYNFFNNEAKISLIFTNSPIVFKKFAHHAKPYLLQFSKEEIAQNLFFRWSQVAPYDALAFLEEIHKELPPEKYTHWITQFQYDFLYGWALKDLDGLESELRANPKHFESLLNLPESYVQDYIKTCKEYLHSKEGINT